MVAGAAAALIQISRTDLLPLVAFALFGSPRHLVVAADSTTAAILTVRSPAWRRSPSRRLPVAPGAGRFSDRRGDSGPHRHARRQRAPACRFSWWRASWSAVVSRRGFRFRLLSLSGRSRQAIGFIWPNTDSLSLARCPADCRRSVYAILGLAAANASAAISWGFVVNGSPTQTAMADEAGARSQVAQLAFAAVVLVVLLFLTGPLQYLPHCVLASIVFTIAVGMVNVQGLSDIRRESPGEYLLALFTATAVPTIGVEQGILLAIALSLVQHVRHSYQPHSMVLAPDATGRWEPAPATPGSQTEPGLIVYRFGADLFYANADRFADEVRSLVDKAPASVRWFILDAGTVTDLDYSAARTVRDLLGELTTKNVGVAFARVSVYLRADLDRHGISAKVGEARIFATLHEALAAVWAGGSLAGPEDAR